MAGVCESIITYIFAMALCIGRLCVVLKDCFVYGFGEVLKKRTYERPNELLDDPSLGTHGFLNLPSGIKIHYVASGPEDKPMILFMHGFPDFWFSWRNQILEFQKDYRVVAIDQRGYGMSDRPSRIDAYKPHTLIEDIPQVIKELGRSSCILVAHDWGGALAWGVANLFPDVVERLIVLNCPAYPVMKAVSASNSAQGKKSMSGAYYQIPGIPEFLFRTRNYVFFDILCGKEKNPDSGEYDMKSPLSDEVIAAYKYTFSQPGAMTASLNWYRAAFRHGMDHGLDYPMPTLLLWGMQDVALTCACPDGMEEAIANIEVRRCDDAGHFIQMENPKWVNANIRDWLQSSYGSDVGHIV